MSDLKALTVANWMYDNREIRTLDLNDLDFDGAEIRTFTLDQEQTFVNISGS